MAGYLGEGVIEWSAGNGSRREPGEGRMEVVVKLADLEVYLIRHRLQAERLVWNGEGLPVLYCEFRQGGK